MCRRGCFHDFLWFDAVLRPCRGDEDAGSFLYDFEGFGLYSPLHRLRPQDLLATRHSRRRSLHNDNLSQAPDVISFGMAMTWDCKVRVDMELYSHGRIADCQKDTCCDCWICSNSIWDDWHRVPMASRRHFPVRSNSEGSHRSSSSPVVFEHGGFSHKTIWATRARELTLC